MKSADFDDETLMAFADGELDDAAAAAVERAIAEDDALMARVAMFIETRARAKAGFAVALDQPVPAELDAAVRAMVAASRAGAAEARPETNVVSLDTHRRASAIPTRSSWRLPLAASLAAAVVAGVVGYRIGGAEDRGTTENFMNVADASVQEVLASLPTGEERELPGAGRIRMIASFEDSAGAFCREFEFEPPQGAPVIAVSCRDGQAWATRFAAAAPEADGGYAPASSLEALETYLAAIGAGPALTQEEEAAALAGR